MATGRDPFRCECGQPGWPYPIKIEIPESRLGLDFSAKDAYCYKCIDAIKAALTTGTFRETLTLRPSVKIHTETALLAKPAELREAEQDPIPDPSKLVWYCINCRTWKPCTMENGDMLCACGYIFASYKGLPIGKIEGPSNPGGLAPGEFE